MWMDGWVVSYLLDGVDSDQGKYICTGDDTRALLLQLLLDLVDDEEAAETKVDSGVFLCLVHIRRVQ